VISLNFSIRGGAASDPKDKPGLSSFATGLLDEGAGPYDSGQFQGKLEDLSAGLSFEASPDYLEGSLKTLSPNPRRGVPAFATGPDRPAFRSACGRAHPRRTRSVDREPGPEPRRAGDAGLVSARSSPTTPMPSRAMAPRPRWRRSRSTISRISPRHGSAATGCRSPWSATSRRPIWACCSTRTFGGLPEATKTPETPQDRVPVDAGKVILVKKPIPQSIIRFGEQGVGIHDKDIYATMVLNYILGGSTFTSRLGR